MLIFGAFVFLVVAYVVLGFMAILLLGVAIDLTVNESLVTFVFWPLMLVFWFGFSLAHGFMDLYRRIR